MTISKSLTSNVNTYLLVLKPDTQNNRLQIQVVTYFSVQMHSKHKPLVEGIKIIRMYVGKSFIATATH
jgi:hypothetical protein